MVGLGNVNAPRKGNLMTGASLTSSGSSGLVPAPSAGAESAFLRGDGTWATLKYTTDDETNEALDEIFGV